MFNIMRYINDTDFQFVFFNSELNIINYDRINYMEDTKISLSHRMGTIVVKGENLRVKKLLDNEMIVCGNIDSIELRKN